MTATIRVLRAGPLVTVQDGGRHGQLVHGVSAGGPMDFGAFERAGLRAGGGNSAGLEFTRAGLELTVVDGVVPVGWDGGTFVVAVNGAAKAWPGAIELRTGDVLSITPGAWGNYGYLRFGMAMAVPMVMGSQSTSTRARLGGLAGRALMAGDELTFEGKGLAPSVVTENPVSGGPIRFIWGLHADRFAAGTRDRFVAGKFRITSMMDRMGVRLADDEGVFAGASILSLVSDPILPGDIQILGDGTPIVLMRDHQPTGGYPRIGTVISADLDRFAQMRPGSVVEFAPVSVEHAQGLLRSRR